MNKKKFNAPSFFIKEANNAWREVLHLAIKQEVPKHHMWHGKLLKKSFSFLDKGMVRLECLSPSGKHRVAFYVESGCIFREVSTLETSFSEGMFVAMEDCTVYEFPATLIRDADFVRKYPELMINMAESLKQKMSTLFSLLAGASEQIPDGVVCRYIDGLAEKHGANTFRPDVSQADLALIMGMHRSTVCRIIKDLREAGILGTFTRYKLEIFDREKLQEYAFKLDSQ